MDIATVNWLAVAACVLVSMASGFVWYNPKTFFNIWWEVVGGDREPGMENMAMVWVFTVLSSIVQAVVFALLLPLFAHAFGGMNFSLGIFAGLILWAGFIAPTYLVNKLFAGHGFVVWFIEVGNHLLNLVLFGAILGAWR